MEISREYRRLTLGRKREPNSLNFFIHWSEALSSALQVAIYCRLLFDLLSVYFSGNSPLEPWILTHYQLGKLHEQKGDIDKAREYYGKFLHIWREGDQDLPPLNDARRRLAALKGRAATG